MKKLIDSMLVLAAIVMTLASCEDVPAPYNDPNNNNNNGPAGTYLSETFNSNLGDFAIVTLKGNAWTHSYSTATATGYNSTDKTNTESESYLVSPEVDLTEADSVYLQFDYIFRYASRDGQDKVLITRNYSGDPTTTTWDDITGNLTEGSDWNTFSTYARQINEYAGSKIRVAFYYSATATNSRTWEVKNVVIKAGKAPDVSDNPGTTTEPTGSGTQADPYNVAAAHNLISTLADDVNSDEIYVKGTVVSVGEVSTSYGNATYYISDDGTTSNQLEVYRGYYLGNTRFTAEDQIKAGDVVVVCGKVVNFRGSTREFTQGNYIYSLNGKTSGSSQPTGDPKGSGTQADPYNVARAQAIIAAGTYTSDEVYVSGTISQVQEISTSYGNATYFISDDGTTDGQLEVYRGYGLNGNRFTSENDLKVGDKVVVKGVLTMFYSTPEITQGSQIVSLNGGGDTPSGDESTLTVNVSSLGLGNAATLNNTLTLSDGTTLSFAQNEGTTAPKSYTGTTSTIRLYAKNAMTITSSSKAITKVVLTCVSNYLGNESLYGQANNTNVTLEKGDNTLTFSGFSSQALSVVNDHTATSGGTQLRITTIAITYAQ